MYESNVVLGSVIFILVGAMLLSISVISFVVYQSISGIFWLPAGIGFTWAGILALARRHRHSKLYSHPKRVADEPTKTAIRYLPKGTHRKGNK